MKTIVSSLNLLIALLIMLCPISSFGQACNCKDYIYLNDTGLDYVEKFEVDIANNQLVEV